MRFDGFSVGEQVGKKKKKRYTLPFAVVGLVWGIISAGFLFLYGQPIKGWIFNLIFFPVYITTVIFNTIVPIFWPEVLDEPSIGGYLLGFSLLIFCSLFIGRLIGTAVGAFIDKIKLTENDSV